MQIQATDRSLFSDIFHKPSEHKLAIGVVVSLVVFVSGTAFLGAAAFAGRPDIGIVHTTLGNTLFGVSAAGMGLSALFCTALGLALIADVRDRKKTKEKTKESQGQIEAECREIEKYIDLLKKDIKKFDDFIQRHPELNRACRAEFKRLKDQGLIAVPEIPKTVPSDDIYEKRQKLRFQEIALEHWKKEGIVIIKGNSQLYQLFRNAMVEDNLLSYPFSTTA